VGPSFDRVAELYDRVRPRCTPFHWVDPAVGWAKAARVLRRPGVLVLLSHVFMSDLTAGELLDLQRPRSTHLHLDPPKLDCVEREIVQLIGELGGRHPVRQLAVVAVSERR
jgi:hypothetical protein